MFMQSTLIPLNKLDEINMIIKAYICLFYKIKSLIYEQEFDSGFVLHSLAIGIRLQSFSYPNFQMRDN